MMKRSGLSISMIFEAFGGNYGENTGNFMALKKISRGSGDIYSYFSRQALCYNIKEQAGWNNTPVTAENKVVQYAPAASIKDYPEIDLFGYMKTRKKNKDKGKNNQTDIQSEETEENGTTKTRSAVARVSPAIALESYNGDLDYLTNMGLAKRDNLANAIAQSEIHRAFYAYSISIDLDLVGVEKDSSGKKIELEIGTKQKIERVQQLLTTVQFLYRDVKGRRENLAPIFIIGGIYERKNPFFDGRLKVNKGALDIEIIKAVLESDNDIKKNTSIGYLDGFFTNDVKLKNDEELRDKIKSITDFFTELRQKVEVYYNASN